MESSESCLHEKTYSEGEFVRQGARVLSVRRCCNCDSAIINSFTEFDLPVKEEKWLEFKKARREAYQKVLLASKGKLQKTKRVVNGKVYIYYKDYKKKYKQRGEVTCFKLAINY